MKYFITEDRISGMIKKTLKEKFPSIYDINIKIVNVQLGADGIIKDGKLVHKIQRNDIQIVINPLELTGGFKLDKNYQAISFSESGQIIQFIENYLAIDISGYGSPWGVDFFYLEPTRF